MNSKAIKEWTARYIKAIDNGQYTAEEVYDTLILEGAMSEVSTNIRKHYKLNKKRRNV